MDGLGPVKVPNASHLAAQLIREAILSGELVAGERLKEEELSQRLEISRTPVREALRILEAEGLVVLESNRGATVRAYTADELDDMYQMRILLEGEAARRAASKASEADVEELAASCQRFGLLCADPTVEASAFVRENLFFHNKIVDITGSHHLRQAIRGLIQLPLVYTSYMWYSQRQKELSGHYHSELVRALGAHDPQRAELVMKEHVYEGRDHLIATIKLQEAAGNYAG